MMGTSFSQTFEIICTPPKITIATKNAITRPMIQGSIAIPEDVRIPVIADA